MTSAYSLIRRRALAADALQVAQEVAALPDPVIRQLLPLLAQAEMETARGLRQWIATVPNAETRYTAYQHARVLLQLRAAFDTLNRMGPALTEALGKGASRAGVLSAQHLQSIVSRNSARFGTSLDAPIRLDLARVVATGQGLIPRFAASAARYSDSVQTQIRQALAVGVLRGETYTELTKRLSQRSTIVQAAGAEPNATTAASGLLRGSDWRVARLARTEMAFAYEAQATEAFHQARRVLPDLRRKWVAAMDMRTCRRCVDMNGSVSDSNGNFVGGDIPLHPHCLCCAVPWREAWGELLSEAA